MKILGGIYTGIGVHTHTLPIMLRKQEDYMLNNCFNIINNT